MGVSQKVLPIKREREACIRQQASVFGDKNPYSFAQDHGNFKKLYQKEKKFELQRNVLWVFLFFISFLSHFFPMRGEKIKAGMISYLLKG